MNQPNLSSTQFSPQPSRPLAYNEAIREGLSQAMELSKEVMVMGQLVDYKAGVFGTTTSLVDRFGTERVQDFPISEAAMSSIALGAALHGMRPVIVHQRVDFMGYSLDSILNWLSLWCFKSNGKSTVPVTIRAVIGKGWGQGPQHSKSLHAWFAHLPGLKVAMPSTAFDAKGLLLESIFGQDPCLILESRSLFSMQSAVPPTPYRVRYGKAQILKPGKDVTLVALGSMVHLALKAAEVLARDGIDAEVIDPRTLSPFDSTTICESVSRTRRLLVADPGWRLSGFAAEVIASVSEQVDERLSAKPVRVTYPDSHTPMSSALESAYYPTEVTLIREVKSMFESKKQ